MSTKYICDNRNCGWTGTDETALRLPDPAEDDPDVYMLTACPRCRDIRTSLQIACDEPGCFRPVTCGTPTPDGYRHTCYEHQPKEPPQ